MKPKQIILYIFLFWLYYCNSQSLRSKLNLSVSKLTFTIAFLFSITFLPHKSAAHTVSYCPLPDNERSMYSRNTGFMWQSCFYEKFRFSSRIDKVGICCHLRKRRFHMSPLTSPSGHKTTRGSSRFLDSPSSSGAPIDSGSCVYVQYMH